jgi:hypothetical protein
MWTVLLIDYLRFYVPLKNFSLIWRRHHCLWRAAKFRPMLSTQGLWAGMDLYCATPAVTWDLGFSGLIRRTAPFSRLLRHTRGCGGSILTRILTGQLYYSLSNVKFILYYYSLSNVKFILYQFWCTRCAFQSFISLQWCSDRKNGNLKYYDCKDP